MIRLGFSEAYSDKNLYIETENKIKSAVIDGHRKKLFTDDLVNCVKSVLKLDIK